MQQGHAFEQIQGFIELVIVLRQVALGVGRLGGIGKGFGVGRNVRRLAFGLIGAVVAQMAGQIGLLDEIRLGAVRAPDLERLELDVGDDAFRLNRTVIGGVLAAGAQLDRRAIAQRQDALHRAFAEGAFTDDQRPPVILQGPGDDLRGGSGTAVDQRHNRGRLQ